MSHKNRLSSSCCAGCAQLQPQQAGSSQTVKFTPLGSHDGEFCPLDRALVFDAMQSTATLDRVRLFLTVTIQSW